MRKKLVYICSPCRGDVEKNIEKAQRYCREAVELWDDVIPIAPHVYFTQFLDDTKQEERAAGMDMGLSLLAMCDELWVYGIENPSEGMRNEIEYAKQHQIPIRDTAELYRNREVEALPIGDALIVLPSHVGNLNGVAAIESTTRSATSICGTGVWKRKKSAVLPRRIHRGSIRCRSGRLCALCM